MSSDRVQTLPPGGADVVPVGGRLLEARERTLELVEPISEDDLDRAHSPLMSPLVWDLGHIAAFADLWVCRCSAGLEPLRPELMAVYDAGETPRAERGEIPYLRRDDALAFMDAVLERALGTLADDPAPQEAFVWEMLVQHEHQHNETMLQTLALAEPGTYAPRRTERDRSQEPALGRLTIPAGPTQIGHGPEGFAYDNERPRHEVELEGFAIAAAPVTNGAFAAFLEDGGYARSGLWTAAGWRWRSAEEIERPLYWTAGSDERRFDRYEAIDPSLPVMHISWFEADAYARWAGARLPSEFEWERAAAANDARRGHLDQLDFGPGLAGPFVGDCWEWTASELCSYPGFTAFPYPEYSEVFFGGDYRVLRGASWATRPSVARTSFRNWDRPERRQIFAGFRLAFDLEESR